VELLRPGAKPAPVVFRKKSERDGVLELGPVKVGTLTLTWRITRKDPSLVERTLGGSRLPGQRVLIHRAAGGVGVFTVPRAAGLARIGPTHRGRRDRGAQIMSGRLDGY
jgi:hypothetical protein